MANPRRFSNSSSNTNAHPPISSSSSLSILSSLIIFLKRPHAFPFLLSVFLLLTWLSLRLQHLHRFSSPPNLHQSQDTQKQPRISDDGDDFKANLVRFTSGFPSQIAGDKRGWLLNPVTVARQAGLSGGAVSCASVHVGQIRPGGVRGNHRHHTCNETFIIWGAETRYRLENPKVDKGYADVTVGAEEVAVASSPSGTAHALVNVDPIRTTFFMGCQDSIITPNSSSTDYNIWKDL